jgi:hypothetical protein
MTTAFYERFSDNTQVEAFSNDAVFTQFSKTDADYTGANCDSKPSSGCIDANGDYDITNKEADCKCLYKEQVDKLYQLKDAKELSEKSLDDGDQQYAAKVLDSTNLVICISIMLGAIYYMNQ